MLQFERPYDGDEERDPEERPALKHPGRDPHDEDAFDPEREALDQMVAEHDLWEAIEEAHQVEEEEEKKEGIESHDLTDRNAEEEKNRESR